MQTTTAHVLDQIPFDPDVPALLKRLHIKPAGVDEFQRLLKEAQQLARPRALYLLAFITDRGEDWLEVNGVRFHSRVLRVNLDAAFRVFPYLVTCGPELQEWAAGINDMLLNFWAEGIKEAALFSAMQAFHAHLENCYQPGKTSSMSPGSLQDWPIQQQVPLFNLFGKVKDQIGVCLTDSLLMVPTKTVSGIRFPTEATFESCQLCPREDCPGRRAPYDPDLFNSRYCLHNG